MLFGVETTNGTSIELEAFELFELFLGGELSILFNLELLLTLELMVEGSKIVIETSFEPKF